MTPPTSLRHVANITATIGWSEFKLRYAGSALGYLWSVSKPLMLFAVMYVVFSQMLRFGNGIENYPVMLLLGIVIWAFFSETTQAGVSVLVAKADLLRKVSFPSVVLPMSVALTASLAMVFNVFAVLLFVFWNQIRPTWSWLLMIPLTIELFAVTVGVTLILSALYVYFRDVGQIWDVFSQALFYGTPIIYPLSIVPVTDAPIIGVPWRILVLCNPLAQIVEQSKRIIVGGTEGGLADVMPGGWFIVPYAIAALIIVVGAALYYRVRHDVVERL